MIKVILADHERIFRIGMASTLAAEDDVRIVGQPTTLMQLVSGVQTRRPHVVILSSSFFLWIQTIRAACRRQHTAILLLRDHGAGEGIGFSEESQAVIDRSTDERTLLQHVRRLARGGRAVGLSSVDRQARDLSGAGNRARERLTLQETTVIAYVVRGDTNREIANRMGRSEQSIKNALRRIFDKAGVDGRLELALFALHHRIAAAPPEEAFSSATRAALFAPHRNWAASGRLSIN